MLAEKLLLGPSSLTARTRVNALARADSSSGVSRLSPLRSSSPWSVTSSLMILLPCPCESFSGVSPSLSSITFIITHFAAIVERDDFDRATADRSCRYHDAPSTGGHRNV